MFTYEVFLWDSVFVYQVHRIFTFLTIEQKQHLNNFSLGRDDSKEKKRFSTRVNICSSYDLFNYTKI